MLALIEFATLIVVLAILVTQVVLPWTESRPYFPALRSRERRLARFRRAELERQREEDALNELAEARRKEESYDQQ